MKKSLFLGFLFILAPLEKLNVYITGDLSITVKLYFILLPVVYYFFLKKLFYLSLNDGLIENRFRLYVTCWGLLILFSVILSIIYLHGSINIGPSLYRLFAIVLFIAIIWIIDDYKDILVIKNSFIYAGMASALFAYYQLGMHNLGLDNYVIDISIGAGERRLGYSSTATLPVEGGIVRVNGFNYDPNLLAITLIIATTSAASFIIVNAKRKYLYIFSIIFMLPALLGTFSRSAYLILGILILFLFFKHWKRLLSLNGIIVISLISMISIVIILVYAEELTFRFGPSGSKSNQYHFLFGYGAIMLGLEHWILGNGIGTFENVYLGSQYSTSTMTRANPHSLPLAIFFELGVVGLIVYSGLIVYILKASAKIKISACNPLNCDLWLFRILFFTLILHNIVNYYFHVELFIIFFAFYVALTKLARENHMKKFVPIDPNNNYEFFKQIKG